MDKDKGSLDDFFAVARDDAPLPSGDLLARIEAQALSEQPVAVARVAEPAWWRQILQALGGWRGATGLVTACAVGLWIGISPPALVDGLFESDTADLGTLGVDPMTGFDLALLEG